jgi:hypothetical protein
MDQKKKRAFLAGAAAMVTMLLGSQPTIASSNPALTEPNTGTASAQMPEFVIQPAPAAAAAFGPNSHVSHQSHESHSSHDSHSSHSSHSSHHSYAG